MTINYDLIINLFTYIKFYETYDFYFKIIYVNIQLMSNFLNYVGCRRNLLGVGRIIPTYGKTWKN